MHQKPASPLAPYTVGAAIGLLSCFVFYSAISKPIGMSTPLSQVAGGLFAFVNEDWVKSNSYFQKNPLQLDYGLLFIIGTMVGAFLSAWMKGTLRWERVPSLWAEYKGKGVAKRYAFAFMGGFLVMLGARLAGGCTSGHGISGGLQLAVSSWLFLAVLFASGILTATLMFNTRR